MIKKELILFFYTVFFYYPYKFGRLNSWNPEILILHEVIFKF